MADLSWPASNRSAAASAETDAPMDPASGTSPTTSPPSYALHAAEMTTLPFTTESTTAPFNHMDPYQRGQYFTEQTVHNHLQDLHIQWRTQGTLGQ